MAFLKRMGNIRLKLLFTFLYLAFVIMMYLFGIPCLMKSFLGIPCPGCGMTRAMLSVLRFDLKAAFRFHPMFWSVPVLYAYILFDGKILGTRRADNSLLISILCGFFINWLFQII